MPGTAQLQAAMSSPPFQLPVAIALTAGTIPLSIAHLLLARSDNTHKTTLPVSAQGDEALSKDPFDIASPEVFVEGTPIDEFKFWKKVCTEILRIACLSE